MVCQCLKFTCHKAHPLKIVDLLGIWDNVGCKFHKAQALNTYIQTLTTDSWVTERWSSLPLCSQGHGQFRLLIYPPCVSRVAL